MAERNYRRDDKIRQTGRYAYIDGSTVRKLQTRPVPEKRETERRQEQPRRRKRTSAKTRRNRARALQMHLRDVRTGRTPIAGEAFFPYFCIQK